MTTKVQRIDKLKEDLADGPNDVVATRLDALNEVQLAEELKNEFLDSFFYGEIGNSGKSFLQIVEEQADIRALCLGAPTSNVQKFEFANDSYYTPSSVQITFPNTTSFGVQVLSLDGSYEITLNSTSNTTQTATESDGSTNTFSVYIGDYYFVQSRKTGSLISTTDSQNIRAINEPNPATPFGNSIAFGTANLTSVEGTWNENYATMNIASLNPSPYDSNTQVITLERELSDGLDDSFETPRLFTPLILKRREAVANTTLDAHTPFAVAVVVGEGMQINTNWLPTGDDSGDYSDPNANVYSSTKLDKDGFISLMGIYHDEFYSGNTSDIYSSLVEDRSTISEPNKVPFFPYVTAKDVLQATNEGGNQLSDRDIFCGRSVYINDSESDNYRFVVDTASKFFYQVNPLLTLTADGTYSVQSLPNTSEPQVEYVTNIDTIISNFTNISYNSGGNYTVNTVHHLFSTSDDPKTAKESGQFSHPTTSTGQGTAFQVNLANGVIGSGTSIEENVTHYYWYARRVTTPGSSPEDQVGRVVLDKYTVKYVRNGTSSPYTYDRTVTGPEVIEGPFLYNQVNNAFKVNAFTRIQDMVNGLEAVKDNYDPNFESKANTAFKTSITDLHGNTTVFSSAHTAFRDDIDDYIDSPSYNGGPVYSIDNESEFSNFKTSLSEFDTQRKARIDILDERIGTVTYKTSAQIDPSGASENTYKRVDTIPILDSNGKTPYGRKIYDLVNLMLDDTVGFFKKVRRKLSSIEFSYTNINEKRNEYEILNGRSKQF